MQVKSAQEVLLAEIKESLKKLNLGVCSLNTISVRQHDNYEVLGTSPLVIPEGIISITVVKDSIDGEVLISGNNSINYILRVEGESFSESVDENISRLSSYTITGSTTSTRFKVHLIK